MNLDTVWDIESTEENLNAHPMGIAVMATFRIPSVAMKLITRRFGMDGKMPPMSNAQVAERYGLPVNIVNTLIGASLDTIAGAGLDNTNE